MNIRVLRGDDAKTAALVGRLFDVASAWNVMLWDVPRAERREALPRALAGADVYAATLGGLALACAWVRPVLPEARAGAAHFCALGGPEAAAAGRAFLEHPELTARYDALIGIIPAPYRHARRFVRGLGFSETIVPGLCSLPEQGRIVAGAFVTLALRA